MLIESIKPNNCFAFKILLFNSSSHLNPYRLILSWHVFASMIILMNNNYILFKSLPDLGSTLFIEALDSDHLK